MTYGLFESPNLGEEASEHAHIEQAPPRDGAQVPRSLQICGTARTASMHKAQSYKEAGRINTPELKPDGRLTLSQNVL